MTTILLNFSNGLESQRITRSHTIEPTFFAEFVYKKALSSPIGEGLEQGKNPRQLEKDQNVRFMNLFAERGFIGQWNPTTGGRQVGGRVQA
jgi:hypothetical protein